MKRQRGVHGRCSRLDRRPHHERARSASARADQMRGRIRGCSYDHRARALRGSVSSSRMRSHSRASEALPYALGLDLRRENLVRRELRTSSREPSRPGGSWSGAGTWSPPCGARRACSRLHPRRMHRPELARVGRLARGSRTAYGGGRSPIDRGRWGRAIRRGRGSPGTSRRRSSPRAGWMRASCVALPASDGRCTGCRSCCRTYTSRATCRLHGSRQGG